MIRVAVLDDHPAVLAGLRRLLQAADGVRAVAAVGTAEELLCALEGARAHVAILDYDLVRSNGLAVCQQLKERGCPPSVVVYSAYAGPALVLAARIAGADAVVDKRAPVRDLLDAVHRVADGERVFPDVPPELRHEVVADLEADEMPVAAMLLAGTAPDGVAEALSTERADVARRTRRIVARLRPKPRSYVAVSAHGDDRPSPEPNTASTAWSQPPTASIL